MKPDPTSPISLVHRLLFQALLEIREQGHEQSNKLVFHLADLFHGVVLEMESAARGGENFVAVLDDLKRRASEKGLGGWLSKSLDELNSCASRRHDVAPAMVSERGPTSPV